MSQDEIRFDRHFIAVWRAKWLIIVIVSLATAVTWWVGQRQPTLHGATALVKNGRVWKEPLEDPYITETAVNSAGFYHELAARIGGTPSYLKGRIRAEVVVAGTQRARYPILVKVASTAESGDEAVRLARAVTDEIIARHQKLFDEALSNYRERERLIEAQLKEPIGSLELRSKLELELNEVKTNNLSPTVTERTQLVEPIVADSTMRPTGLRGVAIIALVSALVSIVVAALVGHFKPTPS
ncbi:MAG: hypothetical protein WAU45_13105 [Blastocatellia bacterium]